MLPPISLVKTLIVTLTGIQLSNILVAFGAPQSRIVRIKLEKVPSLGNELWMSYCVNVAVGTPPKPYRLLVDINAPENLLPQGLGINYVEGGLRYHLPYGYDEDSSSTSAIAYKSAELFGEFYSDTFKFLNVIDGPAELIEFKQRFFAFSARTKEDLAISLEADGVLSLSPWAVSLTGSAMVPNNMARAKLINEARFGLLLDRNRYEQAGGELTLGGVDSTKYKGELKFHKLIERNSWKLNLTAVMFGDEQIAAQMPSAVSITTTSSDIYAPPQAIKKVLKFFGFPDADGSIVDDKKLYTISASERSEAPTLTFDIDGVAYKLEPDCYIRQVAGLSLEDPNLYYISLIPNGSSNMWVLGTNFLSNFYAVFDVGRGELAFGTRSTL